MKKMDDQEVKEWLQALLTTHIGLTLCGFSLMVVTLFAANG